MSILNVDKIQPIGGGSTITVDATDIQATSATITASSFVGSITGNTISFETAGSERARITSAGKVGINTNNPLGDMLTVCEFNSGTNIYDNIALRLQGSSGQNVALQFTDTDGAAAYVAVQGDALRLGTNNAERLRITSTGDVGINENSPEAKLHISHTNGAGIFVDDSSHSSNSPYIQVLGRRSDGNTQQSFSGQIFLSSLRTDQKVASGKQLGTVLFGGNHTDGTKANILYAASIAGVADDNFDSATDMPTALVFKTGTTGRAPLAANVSSGDERLRITSDGKIGINDASPAVTLHVQGANGAVSPSGYSVLDVAIEDNAEAALGIIGNTYSSIYFGDAATVLNGGIVYNHSDNSLGFRGSGNSEAFRIASNGNVVIGHTATNNTFQIGNTGHSGYGLAMQAATYGAILQVGEGTTPTTAAALWTRNMNNGGTPTTLFRVNGNGVCIAGDSSTYDGGNTKPNLYVRGTGGRQMKIHNPNAGTCSLQMTNSTTGQGEDAGTQLFTQGGSGDFWIQSAYATADIAFATKPSGGSTTERFRIGSDGKLYKDGNHFYPLVNYVEVSSFTSASVSSSSYTDLRTIYSNYSPKKAGNLIVIHHQSQMWQGGHANDGGDAMWKIQRSEGGGSWTDTIVNARIMGNMDGRNYTGNSGLARHHRTVHLMGSFTCTGSSFNLKTQGKVDFTSVGLQWYHHNNNILQIWEYEKG